MPLPKKMPLPASSEWTLINSVIPGATINLKGASFLVLDVLRSAPGVFILERSGDTVTYRSEISAPYPGELFIYPWQPHRRTTPAFRGTLVSVNPPKYPSKYTMSAVVLSMFDHFAALLAQPLVDAQKQRAQLLEFGVILGIAPAPLLQSPSNDGIAVQIVKVFEEMSLSGAEWGYRARGASPAAQALRVERIHQELDARKKDEFRNNASSYFYEHGPEATKALLDANPRTWQLVANQLGVAPEDVIAKLRERTKPSGVPLRPCDHVLVFDPPALRKALAWNSDKAPPETSPMPLPEGREGTPPKEEKKVDWPTTGTLGEILAGLIDKFESLLHAPDRQQLIAFGTASGAEPINLLRQPDTRGVAREAFNFLRRAITMPSERLFIAGAADPTERASRMTLLEAEIRRHRNDRELLKLKPEGYFDYLRGHGPEITLLVLSGDTPATLRRLADRLKVEPQAEAIVQAITAREALSAKAEFPSTKELKDLREALRGSAGPSPVPKAPRSDEPREAPPAELTEAEGAKLVGWAERWIAWAAGAPTAEEPPPGFPAWGKRFGADLPELCWYTVAQILEQDGADPAGLQEVREYWSGIYEAKR